MKRNFIINRYFFVFFLSVVLTSCQEESVNNLSETTEISTVSFNEFSDNTTAVIHQWNQVWLELDQNALGMRPNVTARALAYIHLAAYETVVHELDNFSSNENKFRDLSISQSKRADIIDVNIALNKAYAAVFDHFMINIQNNADSEINNLYNSLQNTLSDGLSSEIITDSNEWGSYVAERIIAFAKTDKEAEKQIPEPQPLSYEPSVADGYWTYSADEERALFPYWGKVRTFVISAKQTSSVAPPYAYSEVVGSDYYNEMKEVYEENNLAKQDDNEQLWIAEFWSDDVEELMISPPGRQLSIANQLIKQYNLSYQESIVMLLKLGFSLNDAAVSTWDDKYTYMVMRPNVYIHEFIDPDYQTNLYRLVYWPNPSFLGYPSGHSSFASAAAGVFINQFGDVTNFTDTTHEGRTEFRGTPRTFSSFSEMAAENAFSRIPLGVHIRMDCTEGLRLGYEISNAVNSYNLGSIK